MTLKSRAARLFREVEQRDLREVQILLARQGREEVALPLPELVVLPLPEERAGGLDLLELEEPVDERPPGVLILGQVLLAGQEDLGLDVDEEGGDEQELGLPVEIDPLLAVEVLQVIPGDRGDGDVVDVDLLLPDEEEEQVERALEDPEPDLVAFRRLGRVHGGFGCGGHG
jgi:hypothetical protein